MSLVCLFLSACGESPGRWSGTEWWAIYAALPEWEMTPVSLGALDETTRPFPAVRHVSVSPSGRIAVTQHGFPAVWVYDERGRSLGRAGRSEIMDLRGPERSRVWADRAGWLTGDRLWIAERGGDVAVFGADLRFSDVWEISEPGDAIAVTEGSRGLTALLLSEGEGGSVLKRVTRAGRATDLGSFTPADTVVACPDGSCWVASQARGDTMGVEVVQHGFVDGESASRFRVPRAPDGARSAEDAPLPPAVSRAFVDDEGRTWLGLADDDSGVAYWLILDRTGAPVGRFSVSGGQQGVAAHGGIFWTRRESEGVTWLHRYELSAPQVPPRP